MKDKRTLARELINQILILLSLGVAVVWLLGKRQALDRLGRLAFFSKLIWILPILYIFLLIESIWSINANYLFKRYDPADKASLADLRAIKRYRIFAPRRYQPAGDRVLRSLLARVKKAGYREESRESFGIVLVKGQGKEASRLALIYKPMLNYLIAERHIQEASAFVLEAPRRVPHNALLLISDMDSDEEMLSSGVAAVNFSSKLQTNLILMPYLLDLKHGRLFYPRDISGLSWTDRIYYRTQREKLVKTSLTPPRGMAANR